jgi:hypothetical protein
MKKIFAAAVVVSCALGLSVQAHATPIFTNAAVVTTVDRVATFDNLTVVGANLSSYVENRLSVTDQNILYTGFNAFSPGDSRTTGFWYPSGGDNNYARIVGTDDALFTAFDFLIGDGQGNTNTNIRWQTFLNGVMTGTGLESGIAKGHVVGLSDLAGFDEIRVAAAFSEADPGFGRHQSIALDNLRVQIAQTAAIPEPTSLALLGLGLVGFVVARRRKQ